MLNIVIVSNKPKSQIKTLSTLRCPVPHRLFICSAVGFGNARNVGADECKSGLMVQLNDDLVLSPKLWDFVLGVNKGEFAFQIVRNPKAGDQPCSRVFVIHVDDFLKVGGCDKSLKYFFEDGDFYIRARKSGLKFKAIPDELAIHIPHKHAFYNPSAVKMAKIESEVCQVFVKYKRQVTKDFIGFFVPFRDYRVILQHLFLRMSFMVYWIIKGVNE